MLTRRLFLVSLLGLAISACGRASNVSFAYLNNGIAATSGAQRTARDRSAVQYGVPVKVGNGTARAYVVLDSLDGSTPLEVGVALSEGAMEGLPAKDPHAAHKAAASAHEHVDNHVFLLSLPDCGASPYQFIELDWNPGGHEPPGIYDTPHFDFHFYTSSRDERASIVPTDSLFQKKADMLPAEPQRPPFYVMAAPPGAPAPGVPLMGVHWVDVRSPELQGMMGKPEAYKPFTTTFIYGSWAGRYIFLEPMITRAYIMSKKTATDPTLRNELIPVPTPKEYSPAGYYPSAYRIAWDEPSREYRIAITQLSLRK
jgi:hypothetical protein